MTGVDLAILGGPPAYPDGLRQLRPTLPSYDAVGPRWAACFADGGLTKGPALVEYEQRLAAHLGVRHALAVSSCTTGLMLVLDRYRGCKAFLPSFTFMATAMAAAWAGLDLVFCDVHPHTWSLDPERLAEAVEREGVGPDQGVVIPVHVYGTPADTAAFEELSRTLDLPVVYDAAHGFGACSDGAPVGRQGVAQVFSTSPTKLLITGEGGVVATDDDSVAEHVRWGREYGNPGTYDAQFAGINARLPEAGALLGLASLDLLEQVALRRNELATIYRQRLSDLPGVTFQEVTAGDRCSYKDLSIAVDEDFGLTRDQLAAALTAEGIPTRVYYDPPAHRLTAFADIGRRFEGLLPVTDRLSRQILSLPLYGALRDDDVHAVCSCVHAAHQRAADVRSSLTTAP